MKADLLFSSVIAYGFILDGGFRWNQRLFIALQREGIDSNIDLEYFSCRSKLDGEM